MQIASSDSRTEKLVTVLQRRDQGQRMEQGSGPVMRPRIYGFVHDVEGMTRAGRLQSAPVRHIRITELGAGDLQKPRKIHREIHYGYPALRRGSGGLGLRAEPPGELLAHPGSAEEEGTALEKACLVKLAGQDTSGVGRRILVQLVCLACKLLVLCVIELNANFPGHATTLAGPGLSREGFGLCAMITLAATATAALAAAGT